MSMKLGISNGSMEITDDNQTIVSEGIAKEIKDNYEQSDMKKPGETPTLVVKD